MYIGNILKKIRNEMNLTQEEMAKKLDDLSIHTYRKYEQDLREPKFDMLQKIADALEISVNELIDPMTASKDLLIESLHKDDDIKESERQREELLNIEINKRLSMLNIEGKLEAFKRIDDLRFRIEYRQDLGFSTDLPNDSDFDRWMMKKEEIERTMPEKYLKKD